MKKKIEIESERLIKLKSSYMTIEHEWGNYTNDIKQLLAMDIAKLMLNEGLIIFDSEFDRNHPINQDYGMGVVKHLIISAECMLLKPIETDKDEK